MTKPKYNPDAVETYDIVAKMEQYGGSFVKALADCFLRADATKETFEIGTLALVHRDYFLELFREENSFVVVEGVPKTTLLYKLTRR